MSFKGHVFKIESFATTDGPGIRTVVFLSGCTLRCIYCHNPDMWNPTSGTQTTTEELLEKIERFKPYFKGRGGVTFCGGEPLFQSEFLLLMMKLCKAQGIHVTLDTAGVGNPRYFEEIIAHTDLILLDFKGVDRASYELMTQVKESTADLFLAKAHEKQIPLWIRHVIVPGINDTFEHMDKLARKIKKLENVERVELLPYHTLGSAKYEKLGTNNPLRDIEGMDEDYCKMLQNYLHKKLGSDDLLIGSP